MWGQFFKHLHIDKPRLLWKNSGSGASICWSLQCQWQPVAWLVGWLVEFLIFSWQTSKNMLHGYPSKNNMALKINGWKDAERWNFVLIWSLFTGAVNFLGGTKHDGLGTAIPFKYGYYRYPGSILILWHLIFFVLKRRETRPELGVRTHRSFLIWLTGKVWVLGARN